MGIWRAVRAGSDAEDFHGLRAHSEDSAHRRTEFCAGVGDGRGEQLARAKFRTHLFHIKGRWLATELRSLSRRDGAESPVSPGWAEAECLGRSFGVRSARTVPVARARCGIAGHRGT